MSCSLKNAKGGKIMVRNENRSVSIEILLISIVVLFLFILSSQGDINEINNINSEESTSDRYRLVYKSPDINAHQGVAVSENNFYLFHTDFIKKTDKNWGDELINKNALAEVGDQINHLGDGDYHNGKLYVPVEYWDNHDNFRSQHIAIWNATDLSYIGKHDISAQGHEVAGITVDDKYVYVVSFYDGTAIWKYDISDFSYVDRIPLNKNIENIQGITMGSDCFYISQENYLYKISLAGKIIEKIPTRVNQGIDIHQNFLYCLDDEGGRNILQSIIRKGEYIYTYQLS